MPQIRFLDTEQPKTETSLASSTAVKQSTEYGVQNAERPTVGMATTTAVAMARGI